MKYKKREAYLKAKQAWYDKQSQAYKHSCKRPGSIKTS